MQIAIIIISGPEHFIKKCSGPEINTRLELGEDKKVLHQRQLQHLVHGLYIMKLDPFNKIGFDFLYILFILPA